MNSLMSRLSSKSYHSNDISIQYNGKSINLEKPAYVIDGTTYISLRNVLEQMGMEVTYDEKKKIILISD